MCLEVDVTKRLPLLLSNLCVNGGRVSGLNLELTNSATLASELVPGNLFHLHTSGITRGLPFRSALPITLQSSRLHSSALPREPPSWPR